MNSSGISQSDAFVFIGDADNLQHVDEDARGFIDIPRFVQLLRGRGVSDATMIGNWFTPMEEKLWEGAGVKCVSTKCNADEAVAQAIRQQVQNGTTHVLLGSGDGRAFADLVEELTADGVSVHILSNRRRLSQHLKRVATGFAYSDRFVHQSTSDPTVA